MVASPNLTLTVTPPGSAAVDYTTRLAWSGAAQQLSISQSFGRQGDTALIPLVDEYLTVPNFTIPVFSQVRLADNTAGTVLFAGVCVNPSLMPDGPTRNEWTLHCVDYTFYADNAIVHGIFNGLTVDQILVALTKKADCGITAATVRDGGYVAPGPQLASVVFNYVTLSDAWRRLAQLAGQVTPYGWYVDENRNLHFYDATTAQSSGVTFTTSPTSAGGGSLTEGHFDNGGTFGYEWDGASVRNRILIQGATQAIKHGKALTTAPTDTWRGNDSQTAWPLRYTVTGSPELYVNGVQVPVTIVQAGAVGTGTWQVVQNSVGSYYLVNTVDAPPDGAVLRIWYDYQVPVVAQAVDYASQSTYTGPNRGLFTEYINDTSLTTTPMAFARAMRERTEYAFAAERITFTTTPEFMGWVRAGQTCTLVNHLVPDVRTSYSWGLTGTFIVIGNSVSFGPGGYRQCAITAVRI
jgi:hypothetical protein